MSLIPSLRRSGHKTREREREREAFAEEKWRLALNSPLSIFVFFSFFHLLAFCQRFVVDRHVCLDYE